MSVKKLIFVVNDAGFFVSHRLPIADAAQKQGYEIHICTPPNKEHEALFASKHFIFHSAPLKRGKRSLIDEIKYLKYLYDLYKDNNFDIIHHVTIKPVLFGGIAARIAKAKSVVSAISGMGYVFIKQGFKAKLIQTLVIVGYRFAFKQQKHIAIFQNHDDLDLFIDKKIVNKSDTVLIKGSGVDLEIFKPSKTPKPPITILLPARMLWDKGVGEFVEAAAQVKKQYPNFIFQLAGGVDTENPAAIKEEQLLMWQEKGSIQWLGHCKDMITTIQNAHIVCLPSYREGLPKALIEAMACAKPIITTDVPGCREVVVNNKNGILVPVKDSHALANAIVLLAKKPRMLDEMGQESRKLAESDFSLTMVVEKTLKLYEVLSHESTSNRR